MGEQPDSRQESKTADQQSPYQYASAPDEISLVDLVLIMLRHWQAGIVVFILTMLVAAAYLLLAEPVYESKATISVGTDGSAHNNYIEDPELLVRRLNSGQYRNMIEPSASLNASLDKGRFIELTAKSSDPEAARDTLSNVVDAIQKSHERIYKQILQEYEEAIRNLGANLEQGNIGNRQPDDIYSTMLELRLAKAGSRLSKTEVINEPQLPAIPAEPRYKLIITLSVVLGLFLGLFATFLAEFYANLRTEIRRRGTETGV